MEVLKFMATYNILIKYVGIAQEIEYPAKPIAALFAPTGSYIDTPVYTEGYPVDTGATYGKSVYATNVFGAGELKLFEPYATTSIPMSVPLAQFKLAYQYAIEGTENQVEFTVDDYKEAFYYETIGHQLSDQGFEVTVTEVAPTPSPAA